MNKRMAPKRELKRRMQTQLNGFNRTQTKFFFGFFFLSTAFVSVVIHYMAKIQMTHRFIHNSISLSHFLGRCL